MKFGIGLRFQSRDGFLTVLVLWRYGDALTQHFKGLALRHFNRAFQEKFQRPPTGHLARYVNAMASITLSRHRLLLASMDCLEQLHRLGYSCSRIRQYWAKHPNETPMKILQKILHHQKTGLADPFPEWRRGTTQEFVLADPESILKRTKKWRMK